MDNVVYDNVNLSAFEKRISGTTFGYTNQSFPKTATDGDILSVTYYDDYDFLNTGSPSVAYVNPNSTGFSSVGSGIQSGFVTGSKKRIIASSGAIGAWINKTLFYDQYGNVIQQQSNNLINQNAADITSNAYDIFADRITQTKQTKTAGSTISVINKVSYDIMDRVTQVAMNINGGADQILAKYNYNEIGQLIRKDLHSTTNGSTQPIEADKILGASESVAAGVQKTIVARNSIVLTAGFFAAQGSTFQAKIVESNYLQNVDYRYNIRGWMTSINNSTLSNDAGVTNNDDNDLFGMNLLYNESDASGLSNSAIFNGKISAVKWKSNDRFAPSTNPVRERSYVYAYDQANRLKNGHYSAKNGSAWNAEIGGYDESVTGYDQNGNILGLKRFTLNDNATVATLIDELTYTYGNTGNQISAISDQAGNTAGFKDQANGANEYLYDASGNITDDANKKQKIYYNDLNKVSKVVTEGYGTTEYTYDASGTVVRKSVYNTGNTVVKQLDYMDGFVYSGGTLSYFQTAEGRVLKGTSTFTYEYFIKDHLGSPRISFVDNGSGVAKVVQENEFYPFGLTMQGMVVRTPVSTTANKNLYNAGAELQDDFGSESSYATFYRHYDPAIGRFNAIDPAVDKYAELSPYVYAFNDPVSLNDPMGDEPPGYTPPDPRNGGGGFYYGQTLNSIPPYTQNQNEKIWSSPLIGRTIEQFSPEVQAIIQATWQKIPDGVPGQSHYNGEGYSSSYNRVIPYPDMSSPTGFGYLLINYSSKKTIYTIKQPGQKVDNQGGAGPGILQPFVLWRHYREGNGDPYVLSHKEFKSFIIDMMMNRKIDQRNGIPVPGMKGLYQIGVSAYNIKFDYTYAVGQATLYYNSTGIVGYSDWWNFDAKSSGVRSWPAETATTIGRNVGGAPFFVIYGITPPLNQIPKH